MSNGMQKLGFKIYNNKTEKKSTLLFFKATEVIIFTEVYPEISQVIAINFI